MRPLRFRIGLWAAVVCATAVPPSLVRAAAPLATPSAEAIIHRVLTANARAPEVTSADVRLTTPRFDASMEIYYSNFRFRRRP